MKRLIPFLLILAASSAAGAQTISNVIVASTTGTTATIQWTTNIAATSQIKYGPNPSLQYYNNKDYGTVTSHSMTLNVLTPNTTYYFAVVSGATQSSTYNFSLCGSPTVSVSGIVNNAYAYGMYTATWVPPAGASGTPTACGSTFPTTVTGTLSSSGAFSNTFADSSKVVPGPGTWTFAVQDLADIGPFSVTGVSLTQTSQDISSQLQAAASSVNLQACVTASGLSNCQGASGLPPGWTLTGGSGSGQVVTAPGAFNATTLAAQSAVVAPNLPKSVVGDFGAVGDGVTDNCTALTNMVTWLQGGLGRQVYFPPSGVFAHSCPLSFGTAAHFSLIGSDTESSMMVYTGSGLAGYIMIGTSYGQFQNVGLQTSNSASPPQYAVILGRNSSLTGTDIYFNGATIRGYASKELVYAIASDELMTGQHTYLRLLGGGASCVLYLSETDDESVGNGITTSTSLAMDFSGTAFKNDAMTGGNICVNYNTAISGSFNGSYFQGPGDLIAFTPSANTATGGPWVISGNDFEWNVGTALVGNALHLKSGTANNYLGGISFFGNRATNPANSGFLVLGDTGTSATQLEMDNNYSPGGISLYNIQSSHIIDDGNGPFTIANNPVNSVVINLNPARTVTIPYVAYYDTLLIDTGLMTAVKKAATFQSVANANGVLLKSTDVGVHGSTGTYLQKSDGTGSSGDLFQYDANGNAHDSSIPASTVCQTGGTGCPMTKSGTPTAGAGVCWKTTSQLGTCTAGTWPNCTTCN